MLDNWHYHAQKIAEQGFRVITSDARNHGYSPHTDTMSFADMAGDLAELMEHCGDTSATVMGHSMGGKTAMVFAELFPERCSRLIVADIAPKTYRPGHAMYFRAFEEIDFSTKTSRREAEEAFAEYEQNPAVRQFLLKNLEPDYTGGYKLKLNVKAIKAAYEEIIGGLQLHLVYPGKTAFIRGGNSGYIREEDIPQIRMYFPHSEIITVPGAGHWVHADQPAVFLESVLNFLNS